MTDEAAKPEKSVHEMTIEDILNSDTYVMACEFCSEFPLLVYAVRIAPGAPFSTTNEARVLIGSSGLVTAATMR